MRDRGIGILLGGTALVAVAAWMYLRVPAPVNVDAPTPTASQAPAHPTAELEWPDDFEDLDSTRGAAPAPDPGGLDAASQPAKKLLRAVPAPGTHRVLAP